MTNYQKVGQVNNYSIPAGESIQINQDGTNAYLLVATAAVNMRARSKLSVQPYSLFTQGTGFENTEFTSVEVQNPTASAVVISVWIGRSTFIDRRLILASQATPQVANPTNPTVSATTVNINDLSGGSFTDINGGKWLAISRVLILISNLDTGVVLLVQKTGGTGSSPAILAVQPLTDRAIPVSGNYALNNGGAAVNAIVSEIYLAIPAS